MKKRKTDNEDMRKTSFPLWQWVVGLILFGCNNDKVVNDRVVWDRGNLQKIAALVRIEPPPMIVFRSTFVEDSAGQVAEINFISLWHLYTQVYKERFTSFEAFMFEMLNERLKLPSDERIRLYSVQRFSADSLISSVFDKEGTDGIINRYCLKTNDGYALRVDIGLDTNQANSIAYFLFRAGFIKVQNDYNNITKFIAFSRPL